MEGGINAWNGLVATGAPDAGTAYFPDNGSTEEFIDLALALEEGARRYYGAIEEMVDDEGHKKLFRTLASAEVKHKALLLSLLRELTSTAGPEPSEDEFSEVMEGGMRISEAVEWAKGREIKDILDLSIALETNAYDLYLKMERTTGEPDSKKVFRSLAEEEKNHLDRLTALLDRYV